MAVSSIFQNRNVISVFALSYYYKRSKRLRTDVNSAGVSIGIKHKYKFDQQAYTNQLFIWNGYYKMSHSCAELQK